MVTLTRNHPVDAPCRYISSLPSKGIRSSFIEALNQWFMIKSESLDVIKDIIKMLHDVSLILDDIQDDSPLRRGRPPTPSTYLFVQALADVHGHFDAVTNGAFIEVLQRMHVGQGYDMYWSFHSQCPSEQEYLEMVDGKTGAMFALVVTLMESKSATMPRGDSFQRLTLLFGRFFQVRDDFMNLNSELYAQGKGFCEDLDEEKLSYLLIVCAKSDPDAYQQIMGIFRARSSSPTGAATPLARESKTYILSLLELSGTMKATKAWLLHLESEIVAEIGALEKAHGKKNAQFRMLVSKLSVKSTE
ncbi:geranylgeranyl pyrophosphate synthase [Apiospora aurea]|uniref:Geranylgeranyl pyrophosphate synthase n=1 Tax=Apiospora aurea TaxID=335848 RepID=A0ABR1PXV9_9PEZI